MWPQFLLIDAVIGALFSLGTGNIPASRNTTTSQQQPSVTLYCPQFPSGQQNVTGTIDFMDHTLYLPEKDCASTASLPLTATVSISPVIDAFHPSLGTISPATNDR